MTNPHHTRRGAVRAATAGSGTTTAALAFGLALALALGLALGGCQPSVQVKAPDKPIVINLNVKIEQDVRVRLEKGVDEALQENPDIF